MKTATHPKFGEGTVVEEREDAGARVLTIDFPQHGRKRFRAEFVEIGQAQEASPHLRDSALEEAIRRAPPDHDASPFYRAYGEWLHKQGDAHARLIAFQNDPPERRDDDGYSYSAKLEKAELGLVRDVSVLGPLADAVHSGRLTCRFERGFVAHAELGPADAPLLATLVELLNTTRHTTFLRSVTIRANPNGELRLLWDALERHGLPDTVRWVQLPSPDADFSRIVSALRRTTTLSVGTPRDIPPVALGAVEDLTVEEPSASAVRTLARCELPNLRRLRIMADVLDSGILPALIDDSAHWKPLEVVVVAKGIATLRRLADVEAQERAAKKALPRIHLEIELPIRHVFARAKGSPDVGPSSVRSAFLGEDFPIPGHEPPSTDPEPEE